jgi:uncharacterized protein YceK
MKRIALFGFVLVAAPLCAGCGTCANTLWWSPEEGGMRVYGGVRAHVERLQESPPNESVWDDIGYCAFAAIDMPLSLIGDTLTLPFTIVAEARKPSANSTKLANEATQQLRQ